MLPREITILLGELTDGKKDVVDQLLPLVYEQLQNMAHRQLRGERANHTLDTTGLVHEAYLKLVDQNRVTWQSRAHFFAIAAQAMRRILINYAQARLAEKRGGGQPLATFTEGGIARETKAEELIELNECLNALATFSERQAQVVEFSFFGGLTHEEIAELLGVSTPTIRRDWRLAKAWLTKEMNREN